MICYYNYNVEVVDTLNWLCSNMSVGQFQTEMKKCSQNIAFSSGKII